MDKEKIKENFIKDFNRVKSLGFVESHRSHNTGIGKTFEDLIGVDENNNLLADYMDFIEMKSQRMFSESWITLFTKSPTYPDQANTMLRDNFGYEDEKYPSLKILHTSIFFDRYNSLKEKYGFKLDIKEDKLFLIIKELKTDKIVSDLIYWDFNILKAIIDKKCFLIAFAQTDNKTIGSKEYFHFSKCTLLSGFTFEKFITALKNKVIMFDIRIGAYKSGRNKGKPHDHGSGFRIHKNKLSEYFDIEEI